MPLRPPWSACSPVDERLTSSVALLGARAHGSPELIAALAAEAAERARGLDPGRAVSFRSAWRRAVLGGITSAVSANAGKKPNFLFLLADDHAGYVLGADGNGIARTPNLDRLAKNGLRYTRFHTTALCSPTRAALLTGRNHHSVGMGVITELADAYPGYSGQIPKSAAMVSEVLRQNGYSTEYVGKNHQIADWETSISGPYDRWPSRQGFDHFYGFIGGEADQWQPPLFRDTTPVEMEIPKGQEGRYTLNDSLAEEVIRYIHTEKSVTPDRPFFVYYAPGATHAPHHAPKEWMAKFKGDGYRMKHAGSMHAAEMTTTQ